LELPEGLVGWAGAGEADAFGFGGLWDQVGEGLHLWRLLGIFIYRGVIRGLINGVEEEGG
jgi:hypothetical protein